MNDEQTEQYNRGVVHLYIENATLEDLLHLQHELSHWIKYHREMREERAKNERNSKEKLAQ